MAITQERLRQVLSYCPETGEFHWLIAPNGYVAAGSKAGAVENNGYIRIGVDGTRYGAHRLAWLYMTGEWPMGHIDHKDLNKTNNKWDNLREATESQNHHNRRALSTNRSGFKGVSWHARLRKWGASISCGGRQQHLGYFDDPEVAHRAYEAAAIRLFGEFARAA